MMTRIAAFLFNLAMAVPASAQDRTEMLGLGIEQHGVSAALSLDEGAYVAILAAAPFSFTSPEPLPDVLGVTFGPEGLFDLLERPSETGLFGPGSGYAREEGLDAAHFLTDPLCGSTEIGPGFNYLESDRHDGAGYPVAAIEVDSASRQCEAEGRLPSDTNLIGRINPLHVVVRVDDTMERLVLWFVES